LEGQKSAKDKNLILVGYMEMSFAFWTRVNSMWKKAFFSDLSGLEISFLQVGHLTK
jgi:hypothetical protein